MPEALYGPFGALALLLAGIVAFARMFLAEKPLAVPGYLYRKLEEKLERAEAREALLIKSIPTLTRIAANGEPAAPPEPGAPSG